MRSQREKGEIKRELFRNHMKGKREKLKVYPFMSAPFAYKSHLHHSIQLKSLYSCENIFTTYERKGTKRSKEFSRFFLLLQFQTVEN